MWDIGTRVVESIDDRFRQKILPLAGGDRALGVAVTAAMLALLESKDPERFIADAERAKRLERGKAKG